MIRPRAALVALAALVLASSAACSTPAKRRATLAPPTSAPPSAARPPTTIPRPPDVLDVVTLTADPTARYRIGGRDRTIAAAAAAGTMASPTARVDPVYGPAAGGNLRVAIFGPAAPTSVNQQACATWTGPYEGTIQPGVVLRSRTVAGRTRAILVTNNIWQHLRPAFNVSLVDTAAAAPIQRLTAFLLSDAVGTTDAPLPLPWRICGRVIGTTVEVKVWSVPTFDAEPHWGDGHFGGSVQVPPQWVFAGRPGTYLGHLDPGQRTTFTDVTATTVRP